MSDRPDPAAIARGLSEQEREFVLAIGMEFKRGVRFPPLPSSLVEYSGFMGAHGWIHTARLTPLGLSVRAHLESSDAGA